MTRPFNKTSNYEAIVLHDHIITLLVKIEIMPPEVIANVKDMLVASKLDHHAHTFVVDLIDYVQEHGS